MTTKKIDLKYNTELEIKPNEKKTSFDEEKYDKTLFQENNVLFKEIHNYNDIHKENSSETLKDILNSPSYEKKEKHFIATELWIETIQLKKPDDFFKWFDKLLPYLKKVIKIVREQILTNAFINSRTTKKNAVKTMYGFPDFLAPVPRIHSCLMAPSNYLILDTNFQIQNSKIENIEVWKKKPLLLLDKVDMEKIKRIFHKKRQFYLRLLKKNSLLVNASESEKQVFAEFEDFLKDTFVNLEQIQKIKIDKDLLIRKTDQAFEEATNNWYSFLKERQVFENQENNLLAAKILDVILRSFKISENSESTTNNKLNVCVLWEKIYRVLLDSWLSNFEKEHFQIEKMKTKELSFRDYKQTNLVLFDSKKLRNQIQDYLINMTSVKSTLNKLKKDPLTKTEKESSIRIIKKEVSRISEPLVEALFESGILKWESSKEGNEGNLQEDEFRNTDDFKKEHYNVITLNLNTVELKITVDYFEKNSL